ncbi:phosphate ABC transporter, inner membrane subunit PstA [Dethiosulfovibrio peptidovorans DSM 11002]|uniref:Phosphate transport system permease protein PstA n=1 Tax=Dethiosulfovibrio peptidovorans DSM 11002 TaxID=469381 RepID=D2Z5K9_9BACT|nr:phosphate ABC transporter permease PstA [Dethiosulfovibrio peptidovorans]EFC90756.1 phosphate ABC transporter, inner membrane subunit PstA [Dethiosulfovibrio peptidovorans DSM 11002]
MSRKLVDRGASILLWTSAALLVLGLLSILAYLMANGAESMSWEFVTRPPRDNMTKGGISTPIIGTLQLVIVSMVFAIPVGVATGIFFAEYATEGPFTTALRLCVRCLAGVPSVVYGLFGLSLFVVFLNFGSSLLSAGLTLACLSLPLIVTASETALLAVPQDFRLASYALGANKWQTVRKVVLPAALPTILTGAILSVGRVAGETAPIIFTGAAFFTPKVATSLFDEVMALPYHIMVLATAGTHIEQTRPIQYGTVLVLILLVMGVSSLGIILRARLRRNRR